MQNGDVGFSDNTGFGFYVQVVNHHYTVFRKSDGFTLQDPSPTKSLFTSGDCAAGEIWDPIVRFDRFADAPNGRWVISGLTDADGGVLCIAVSKTADPRGGQTNYHAYEFRLEGQARLDFQKLGVWPDATGQAGSYVVTVNRVLGGLPGQGFATVCAFERAKMIAGLTPGLFCDDIPNTGPILYTEPSVLPSDLDGPNLPPADAPNYILGLAPLPKGGTATESTLRVWKLDVRWGTPTASLSGPTTIPVEPFTSLRDLAPPGVPQKDVGQELNPAGDRLMNRLVYRYFPGIASHASWVVTHAVDVDPTAGMRAGVRWYELRLSPHAPPWPNPTVYRHGTHDPADPCGHGGVPCWRWSSSAAMDGQGNIAVGYSVSSNAIFASIRAAGRFANDADGQLPQGEKTIKNGDGSQTVNPYWGDYNSMNIDPSGDCRLWYTNQYLAETQQGDQNWHTHIVRLRFQGCGS